MTEERLPSKFTFILHADIASSTSLVQQDEGLAHERIQETFHRFSDIITQYRGRVRELRGDALLAEFDRASDAVTAALAFQADQFEFLAQLDDSIQPKVRVGIAMGEVIIADDTITGEGVVLAQRVEQLADPGGVCVTGAIQEALPTRLPFDQGDLGEQQVKGFDKPVHVYSVRLKEGATLPGPTIPSEIKRTSAVRWIMVAAVVVLVCGGALLAWLQPWKPDFEPASVEHMSFPLPDKPSIAVLPFTNMSNDAEQEYFVDGMTEDLITDLSKISGLFVIARNSSFTYKGKAVDVKNVARDLGVRYVMEGSVRRTGNQVRINAQLIDATTGGHLWAERYDGSLEDVFALQDQVTENIVAALSVKLTAEEIVRAAEPKRVVNPQAYDSFLRGWEHFQRRTPEHFAKAISFYDRAIKLAPDYSEALAAMAALYWEVNRKQWYAAMGLGSSADVESLMDDYLESVRENPTPLALVVSADRSMRLGQYDQALATIERAIKLAPNSAEATIGKAEILAHMGRSQEALDLIPLTERLDPLNQAHYAYVRGLAEFNLEKYEAAIKSLTRALDLNPAFKRPAAVLAASFGQLGREDEALKARRVFASESLQDGTGTMPGRNQQVDDVRGINSTLLLFPFKEKTDKTRLAVGLQHAGMPIRDSSFAWW